jgi:hypothetical protein
MRSQVADDDHDLFENLNKSLILYDFHQIYNDFNSIRRKATVDFDTGRDKSAAH